LRRALAQPGRPHLRAELIFKATLNGGAVEARLRAVELVAGRIVDACTGAVWCRLRHRRARRAIRASPDGDGCQAAGAAASSDDTSDDDEDKPLRRAVAHGHRRAMAASAPILPASSASAPRRGRLTYEVAGNGSVQCAPGRRAHGTPTGDCIVEAAHGARFPRFDGPVQTFTLPLLPAPLRAAGAVAPLRRRTGAPEQDDQRRSTEPNRSPTTDRAAAVEQRRVRHQRRRLRRRIGERVDGGGRAHHAPAASCARDAGVHRAHHLQPVLDRAKHRSAMCW